MKGSSGHNLADMLATASKLRFVTPGLCVVKPEGNGTSAVAVEICFPPKGSMKGFGI